MWNFWVGVLKQFLTTCRVPNFFLQKSLQPSGQGQSPNLTVGRGGKRLFSPTELCIFDIHLCTYFWHPAMYFWHPSMYFWHPSMYFWHPSMYFWHPTMYYWHPLLTILLALSLLSYLPHQWAGIAWAWTWLWRGRSRSWPVWPAGRRERGRKSQKYPVLKTQILFITFQKILRYVVILLKKFTK